jgi:hypothetical protein
VLPLFELAEARVDVAAQRLDDRVWTKAKDREAASQARRTDAHALRQRGERRREVATHQEHVARIGALGHADDAQSVGLLRGQVLHRVHRDVGAALEERLFDLANEQALAADLVQRSILDAIAGGDHLQLLDLEAGVLRHERADERAGLGEGKGGTTRGDDDSGHGDH